MAENNRIHEAAVGYAVVQAGLQEDGARGGAGSSGRIFVCSDDPAHRTWAITHLTATENRDSSGLPGERTPLFGTSIWAWQTKREDQNIIAP